MKRILTCIALMAAAIGLPLATPAAAAGSTGTTGLAVGDFDGDGHDDLAVGASEEDVGPEGSEIEDGGQVHVIYGSADGLKSGGNQVWRQNSPGIPNSPEVTDYFGTSVAAGDVNGDGRDDLAIGVPGEGLGISDSASGAVHVLYGGPNGLSAVGDEFWHQGSPGIKETVEGGEQFGHSLAMGDFGDSAKDDLAIGAPFEDLNGSDEGVVHVLSGTNGGLTAQGDQLWHQDVEGVKGVADDGDNFGWSLAAADFGRNGNRDDLAIGVPEDSSGATNSVVDAGSVNVLYGRAGGLNERGDQRWNQDTLGIKNYSENDDGFGWSVTAANLGHAGSADIAIGSPFEDVGPEGTEVTNAGSVNVLYGRTRGLKPEDDQFWTRLTPGIPGSPEEFANFGNTLAAANLGKTGVADLAVGTVFGDVPLINSDEGEVTVIYGRDGGLNTSGRQSWTQESEGVKNVSENDDYFGASMAAGDFGKSNRRDLAIGAPGEDAFAGGANVLYGRENGLSAIGDQFWQQGLGIQGTAEGGDGFSKGQYD
jgi:hypothetical protein